MAVIVVWWGAKWLYDKVAPEFKEFISRTKAEKNDIASEMRDVCRNILVHGPEEVSRDLVSIFHRLSPKSQFFTTHDMLEEVRLASSDAREHENLIIHGMVVVVKEEDLCSQCQEVVNLTNKLLCYNVPVVIMGDSDACTPYYASSLVASICRLLGVSWDTQDGDDSKTATSRFGGLFTPPRPTTPEESFFESASRVVSDRFRRNSYSGPPSNLHHGSVEMAVRRHSKSMPGSVANTMKDLTLDTLLSPCAQMLTEIVVVSVSEALDAIQNMPEQEEEKKDESWVSFPAYLSSFRRKFSTIKPAKPNENALFSLFLLVHSLQWIDITSSWFDGEQLNGTDVQHFRMRDAWHIFGFSDHNRGLDNPFPHPSLISSQPLTPNKLESNSHSFRSIDSSEEKSWKRKSDVHLSESLTSFQQLALSFATERRIRVASISSEEDAIAELSYTDRFKSPQNKSSSNRSIPIRLDSKDFDLDSIVLI